MNGFKKCNNGHFYKEDLAACPYCPGSKPAGNSNAGSDLDKTIIPGAGGGGSDSARTEVFGNTSVSGESTKVFGGGNSGGSSAPKDLGRTYIGGVTDADETDDSGRKIESSPRAARKIVGWIISYTLDPMGVDYRIYEGSNTIGRNPGNTITISADVTVSGEHVNILYRNGKFYIKDKMTANGTFLNGEELEVEKAYELKDSDEVRCGNTVFKFKSCD
jgi:hypothetical protein